ncbi:hypothetical protein JHK82_053928 [Glycine max]|nr:hypothetical protein JHK85_054729 [Glycine max]KAG5083762.1 hypothetical protein JHK84_053800 [Glycine max]KAG5086531.1 hypothetical protein JHK82_053928 [Glycine max]
MSSICISNCINDARDPRVPVRASYVNLYKWPESDAEFVRQMYLRSYTFSREEENELEKTHKCFGRAKMKKKKKHGSETKPDEAKKTKCLVWSKAKEVSCSALSRILRRVLSCSASVDVVDEKY